jgi:hypothetical protein
MGLFAEWQPRYAEHRIPTFPVSADKKPGISNYQKIGTNVSAQIALRFPNHDAFGVGCKISRLTVLDVDTNDERVLADGLDEFGPTPFIVRSGSGNFQAWYRNNGESRRVRPDPRRPIDILGSGFVVAPPSRGRKGQYQIISGTLDDLDNLPKMRGLKIDPNKKQNTSSSPSSLPPSANTNSKDVEARNNALWRDCMKIVRGCRNIEELMVKAMDKNREYYQPLPADEVLKIVASAWSYEVEGKNWFGHGHRVVVGHSIVDQLAAADPRAYALFSLLQRHHWGRDFHLTKSYAAALGWAINTFRAARDILLERGLIECIHAGGRGPNDPPVYRFTKAGGAA